MPEVSEHAYVDYLSSLEQDARADDTTDHRVFDPDCGCLVTNISALPVSTLDFGTGPPALAYPTTIERNSVGIYSSGADYVLRYAN